MIRSRVLGVGGWACLSVLMACNGSISGDGSGAGTGGTAGMGSDGGDDADFPEGGGPPIQIQVQVQVTLPNRETCGDGAIQAGEQCDGENLAGRSCRGLGFDAGTLACFDDCTFDASQCELVSCGDGVINDPLEACDRDDLNGESCESLGFDGGDLSCSPGCGFDTVSCLMEDCYDRRDNDADGLIDCADSSCSVACADACFAPPLIGDPGSAVGSTVGHSASLESGCGAPVSGPEVVYRVVAAKAGVLDVMLASHSDLGIAAFTECGAGPRGCSDVVPGGGRERLSIPVEEGETLFLVVDGHGAQDAGAYALDVQSRAVVCGDGVAEGLERCDDGNANDGDGCSSTCEFECDVLDCDDGDACTLDPCDPESGCNHQAVDPDDGDACTVDACDPSGGVTHALKPNVDDQDICTFDFCDPGTGVISRAPAEYLSEDFSAKPDGWAFGDTWESGPAHASSGQIGGHPDPASDHSAMGDDGVAGTKIGGNVGTNVHAPFYLETPPVDLSKVPGPVTLEFWRWLNSDYPPYANATVEVYDGAAWVQVFGMVSGVPIQDNEWKLVQVDITAYKSSKLQVRWGYSIGSSSAFDESGWNIDDVRIIPGDCE